MTDLQQQTLSLARTSPAGFAWYCSDGLWKPAPHLKLLNRALIDLTLRKYFFLIVTMPPQNGKALEINTPIPTPYGWKKIIDLKVGDIVFDSLGNQTKIIAVSEVWKNRNLYSVVSDSGDEIVCDEEHEWMVRLERKRPKTIKKWKTKDLFLRTSPRNPLVYKHRGLELPETILPIDPYVFGYWLGDGTCSTAAITCGLEDISFVREKINKKYITTNRSISTYFGIKGIQAILRSLNLLDNKHIPINYLRSSYKQRLDLLNGLIDSDGYVSPVGQIEFCSINKKLAYGVKELINSFGYKASIITGRATLYGKDCGEKYRVMFYMPNAASLPRKLRNCIEPKKHPHHFITVKKLDRFGDTVCIQVASETHMYLAGYGMIPTHNSSLVSGYFPPWYLGTFPHHRVILGSYEAEKAEEWGAKAKDTFIDYGEKVFGLSVKGDTKRKSFWRIEGKNGSMSTAGIGGPMTGKSADLLIIDDPVKNAEEANSKAVQERNWDWWRTVAFTRRQPGAITVIPSTRWSKNDLVGKILDSPLAKSCHVLNLEGICENANDPLGRNIGEALWPDHFPLSMMHEFKDTLGPYWWDALYMGRPNDPLGTLFQSKWFMTFKEDEKHYILSDGRTFEKKDCWNLQTIDPAATTNKQSDYFVLMTMAVTPDKDILVLDIFRDKIGADRYEPVIKEHYNRWFPNIIGVENKTFGLTIMQQLKKFYPFRPCEADQDKLARSMTAQARYSLGKIFHKVNNDGSKPSYINDFETELKEFATGVHDDMVDAISYAAIMVMNKKKVGVS